jgi:hypothetical protein
VALLLINLLAVSSLILIGLVSAHSTPKPSVPEFTAKMADHSYDVPLTTVNYTNPYTGQQETKANGGFHVENITIDIEIKNQHFTSIDIDGNTTGLFYVIRWKGHFENWSEYSNSDFNDVAYDNSYQGVNYAIPAANSDYTIKSYSLSSMGNIPQGGLVDFQVKAQIGYSFTYFGGHIQPIGTDYHWVQESDWSDTQTVKINENTSTGTPGASLPSPRTSPSNSQSSSQSGPQTLTQMGLDWGQVATFALLGVIAVLLVFAVVFLRRKSVKPVT